MGKEKVVLENRTADYWNRRCTLHEINYTVLRYVTGNKIRRTFQDADASLSCIKLPRRKFYTRVGTNGNCLNFSRRWNRSPDTQWLISNQISELSPFFLWDGLYNNLLRFIYSLIKSLTYFIKNIEGNFYIEYNNNLLCGMIQIIIDSSFSLIK